MYRGDFIGGSWYYDMRFSDQRDPLWRRIDSHNKVRELLAKARMDPRLIESARYYERGHGSLMVVSTCEIPLTTAAHAAR